MEPSSAQIPELRDNIFLYVFQCCHDTLHESGRTGSYPNDCPLVASHAQIRKVALTRKELRILGPLLHFEGVSYSVTTPDIQVGTGRVRRLACQSIIGIIQLTMYNKPLALPDHGQETRVMDRLVAKDVESVYMRRIVYIHRNML